MSICRLGQLLPGSKATTICVVENDHAQATLESFFRPRPRILCDSRARKGAHGHTPTKQEQETPTKPQHPVPAGSCDARESPLPNPSDGCILAGHGGTANTEAHEDKGVRSVVDSGAGARLDADVRMSAFGEASLQSTDAGQSLLEEGDQPPCEGDNEAGVQAVETFVTGKPKKTEADFCDVLVSPAPPNTYKKRSRIECG